MKKEEKATLGLCATIKDASRKSTITMKLFHFQSMNNARFLSTLVLTPRRTKKT